MAKKNKGRNPNQKNYHQSANSKKERIAQLRQQYEQRIKPVPSRPQFSEDDLQFGIAEIEKLFTEANQKIEYIKAQGYTSYAIDRVESEGGRDYFDTDVITDRESLIRELYRVRTFLADKGSTVEGAIIETAQINSEIYKGKFGNQYNTEEFNYKRYDDKLIDGDAASRAFRAYRNIESHRASEIVGEGAYGSENLIIALYDAEIRGQDSLVYGEALLDAFQKQHEDMWNRATSEADEIGSISGVIADNIRERLGF